MSVDAISQSRADQLHPVARARILATIEDCAAAGIYLRLTQGLRTQNEQHTLYIQGRQPLDVVNEARAAVGWASITEDQNREVTNADFFQSMHCYGLAGDVDPSEGTTMAPFNPDWDVQDAEWQKVLAIAASHQLAEGAKWTSVKRDYPHLYPHELDANPTQEMQQTLKDAGLDAVWAELDTVLPRP
jgi:peptidoglycan L-alanyl-D-glutamate endopeptidase CwlK